MTDAPEAGCTIRPATVADHDQLTRLWAVLDEHHRLALPQRYRTSVGPARAAAFVEVLIAGPRSTILVACDRLDRLIGLCVVKVVDQPELPIRAASRFAEVVSMVVDPQARRRGVAQALVEGAEAWARGEGATALELGVYAFNGSAVAFYRRSGFATLSHRMAKPLG